MHVNVIFNVMSSFLTMSILFGKIIEGKINKIYLCEYKENVLIDFYLFPIQRTEKFHHKMLNNQNLVQWIHKKVTHAHKVFMHY